MQVLAIFTASAGVPAVAHGDLKSNMAKRKTLPRGLATVWDSLER